MPVFSAPGGNGIIGGQPASPNHWRSVVALRASTTDEAFCGGNLIHPRWVITAAHCLKQEIEGIEQSYEAGDLIVFAGSHNLRDHRAQRIKVKRVIIHPRFKTDSGDHDIALLELAQDAKQPIMKLYTLDPLANTAVTAVGWGSLKQNAENSHFPDRLYQVSIPVVDRKKCRQASLYRNKISNNMLCAGLPQGGKDSCTGDSGGPLMLRQISDGMYYQVGIISHGLGCGQAGQYGVYTLVPAYANWIKRYAPVQTASEELLQNEIIYQRMAGSFSIAGLIALFLLSSLCRSYQSNACRP